MENISVMVWNKLNHFIGSRELVFYRQIDCQISDLLHNDICEFYQIISSGSRAEGLSLPGSDIDMMVVFEIISVKLEQDLTEPNADLVMDTSSVKPGFTKLYTDSDQSVVHKHKTFASALTPANCRLYLSSLLFRDKCVEFCKDYQPQSQAHGPCATFKHGDFEYDYMACFPCKIWPPEAEEWTLRQRRNNWLSSDLVSDIVNEGCLVVPIGNPLSEENHIEWRLSFSLAEKKLVHFMNHTQVLCYGLLKLYLKNVIESRADCKGLLCSYFLKTSVFYCIEEENLVWDKHNLLKCFWVCFKRLFLWVRQGYCPNYFISTNNMFESKIYGEHQAKLKEHLFHLYEQGIDSLLLIPVLHDLYTDMFGRTLPFIPNQVDIEKVSEYQFDKNLTLTTIYKFYNFFRFTSLKDKTQVIIKLKVLQRQPNIPPVGKHILTNFLETVNCCIIQYQYQSINNSVLSNKMRYREFRRLSRYILQNCTKMDICTGLLQYATLCYLSGHYNKVVCLVEHILFKFKHFQIYASMNQLLSCKTHYIGEMCGKRLTLQYKRSHGVARSYACVPSTGFYPDDIKTEIYQHQDKYLRLTFIPPRIFCFVLLFLTYNRTGMGDLRDNALDDMFQSVEDRHLHFIQESEKPLVSALIQRCVEISNR